MKSNASYFTTDGKKDVCEKELREAIKAHQQWLRGEGGTRMDFSNRGTIIFGRAGLGMDHKDEVDLSRAIFRGCTLVDPTICRVNLSGADFSDCDIIGGRFLDVRLKDANFARGRITHTYFHLAPGAMDGANFTSAFLHGVTLFGDNLNMTGAELENVSVVHRKDPATSPKWTADGEAVDLSGLAEYDVPFAYGSSDEFVLDGPFSWRPDSSSDGKEH